MNTNQLQCVIDCDHIMRRVISGVYARDQIPTMINKYPYGFIVNTDTSNRPERHWLAFYCESEGTMELFDSYGVFFVQSKCKSHKTFTE